MNSWAWILITEDGVTRYRTAAAAYAAAGVDVDSDSLTGAVPYALEFIRY